MQGRTSVVSRGLRIGLVTAGALLALGMPLAWGVSGSNGAAPDEATDRDFDRNNFSNGPKIDNKWSPFPPGTQFILEGRANRGGGRLPHRVVFTVTDLTKVIDGVRTRVIWDRDFNSGRLFEGELAFFAQDDDGNVWTVGEYPEEYDRRGRFKGAPDTWLAGLEGARAGVHMRANPRLGTSSYLQGWAPKIEFADRARVLRMGQRDCVPIRCYRNVLVTDEWNPSEPGEHQQKFYAPGVGNIRVGAAGGKERETLVLVKVRRLTPAGLAFVRREALKLETRAYRVSKDLYGKTPPMERIP